MLCSPFAQTPTGASANATQFAAPLSQLRNRLAPHVSTDALQALVGDAAARAVTAYHSAVCKWFESKNAKLRAQLRFDVEEIVQQVDALSVDLSSCETWASLKQQRSNL